MATRRESGSHATRASSAVASLPVSIHRTSPPVDVHHANVRDRIRRSGLREAFFCHVPAVGKRAHQRIFFDRALIQLQQSDFRRIRRPPIGRLQIPIPPDTPNPIRLGATPPMPPRVSCLGSPPATLTTHRSWLRKKLTQRPSGEILASSISVSPAEETLPAGFGSNCFEDRVFSSYQNSSLAETKSSACASGAHRYLGVASRPKPVCWPRDAGGSRTSRRCWASTNTRFCAVAASTAQISGPAAFSSR